MNFNFKIHWGWVHGATLLDQTFLDASFGNDVEAFMDWLVAENKPAEYHTMNPLLINYLEDEVGKQVVYIDSKRFDQYPSLLDKLEFMGTGDAVCDTDFWPKEQQK